MPMMCCNYIFAAAQIEQIQTHLLNAGFTRPFPGVKRVGCARLYNYADYGQRWTNQATNYASALEYLGIQICYFSHARSMELKVM